MMKKRKGSTLLLTLMVFSILMIFGTFILNFMVTENKQSFSYQYKTQAYYIARGGAVAVEAAILKMDEEQIEQLEDELKEKREITLNDIDIEGNKAIVTLRKEDEKLYIESLGRVGDVVDKVVKVMEKESTSTETVEIDMAVFSHGDIVISNGKIEGDIGTNGDITISNNPTITGKAYLAENSKFTGPDWWLRDKWSDDRAVRISTERNYSIPVFSNYIEEAEENSIPEFPKFENYPSSLPLSPVLNFDNVDEITVDSNGRYEKINIPWGKTLVIDASERAINIWTEELSVYQILVKGSHEVNIHIKSKFTTNSGSQRCIFRENHNSNINIYFSGGEISLNSPKGIYANIYIKTNISNIKFNNSQVFGDVYIYNSNFETSGNQDIGIKGNIFSKSGNIKIPNGYVDGNIYSYNGNVELSGSASMYGNIYSFSGNVVINGSGMMKGSIYVNNGNTVISGSGRVVEGNLYVNSGNIEFKGSGIIYGNIISSGIDNDIKMGSNGTPLTVRGIIYAPQSNIVFTNNSPVAGGIVGKTISITGNVDIKYNSDNIDTSLIKVGSSTSTHWEYKAGYFQ